MPTARLLHGLAPELGEDPQLLILGSFPGALSLEHHEYYGNPRNQFWPMIEAVFGIDRTLPYPVRLGRLHAVHVGLWDVVASCERSGSSDASIRNAVANDIAGLLDARPGIRHIVLNGSTGAGRWFDRLLPGMRTASGITVETFPSTSPANARYRFSEKVAIWKKIGEYVG
jgi:TDG/mug DNA glycosylase family protein